MDDSTQEDVLPVIRLTVEFSLTVDELWNRFWNPIHMIQWLGNEIDSDIREGGSVRFMGKNAPTTTEIQNHWSIKRVKEGRAVLCSWSILGVDTLFVLRFTEHGTGSMIEVKHGAIPVAAQGIHLAEHWNVLLANFKSAVMLKGPAIRFEYTNYRPLRITRYDPKDVRISVLVHAPPQIPFDVWTNPEKLKHFIRAETPKVDRQYAGIYTWWAEGMGPVLFTKMDRDREIEFTWFYKEGPETKVNVRFEEARDDTIVTLHHYGFNEPDDVVGYDIGWTSILCELKLVSELGATGIERVSEWEGSLETEIIFDE
ncbi:MAG: SRPBCC family protein [Candidatus Thorarchaeota archaeon]